MRAIEEVIVSLTFVSIGVLLSTDLNYLRNILYYKCKECLYFHHGGIYGYICYFPINKQTKQPKTVTREETSN